MMRKLDNRIVPGNMYNFPCPCMKMEKGKEKVSVYNYLRRRWPAISGDGFLHSGFPPVEGTYGH
jgi:hypothetical protein